MEVRSIKSFCVVLLLAFLLMPPGAAAQQTPGSQPTGVKEKKPIPVPDLADLIPLTKKLVSRLAVLEQKITGGYDVSAVEKGFSGIEAKLEDHSRQLMRLKASESYSYEQLINIRGAIRSDGEALEDVIEPLTQAIRKLAVARRVWLDEKKRWNEWQSVMLKDEPIDAVKFTFARAQNAINAALSLIHQQLQPLLAVLKKAWDIEAKVNDLSVEVDNLIMGKRRVLLPDANPPMFSWNYLSQLRNQAWYELRGGMRAIAWPEMEFFGRQGWLFVLQVLLFLAVMAIIFRHRRGLAASERWGFLAQRPVAAGIFLATLLLYPFYEASPLHFLLLGIIGGISGARLLAGLMAKNWQSILIYGLVGFIITTHLLIIIGLPHPIFRLYIVLASLVGIGLCWWASVHASLPLYIWMYRVGSLIFVVMLIAELDAYSSFAEYLMRASLHTLGVTVGAWLLIYIVRGGIEGLVYHTQLQRVPLMRSNPAWAVKRLARITDVLIMTLYLVVILVVWRVYATPVEAVEGFLSLGFTVGSSEITVGLLLTAAGFIYGAFLLSWIVQSLLIQDVFAKRKVETGVQLSVARLVHYALVFLGFLLALLALGFDLTKLTIMISALGVGIGFGLQTVVNNFVCGLIMLFERPVKMGDWIEISGQWAEIRKIGLRATVVRTLDNAEIVVPNSDLVTNQVTNWTLTDRRVRLIVPVGVAYGSDIALVIENLLESTKASSRVLSTPEPQVLFRRFGESSLDFEVRAWIANAEERLRVISDLHQEIDRRFRQAGITIAFPQRDLHLRSVDESVSSRLHPPEHQPLNLVPGDQRDKKNQ